jgi:hypothetical protein
MEARLSSETSGTFLTALPRNPKDRTFHLTRTHGVRYQNILIISTWGTHRGKEVPLLDSLLVLCVSYMAWNRITNSVALVLERTIPTERPQLFGEVSANFWDRGLSHGQCGGSHTAVISVF